MNDMIRRKRATDATLKRYRDNAFDWSRGVTCIHLARFHARQMGHRPPSVPRIRSALGARRALAATGHETLASLLDSMFPRIAPARMVLGDLALLPGDGGETVMGALVIHSGGPKLLGWHGADNGGLRGLAGLETAIFAAWRL